MKRKILLVEDDDVFLRPLHRTLELAGYDVLPVPSAEDALEALKGEDVDVVLTDKRLPGMDGVELVRRVKADHADLAVVVMTAYGTIESAVEAMRLGAEDYLVKPFEVAELLLVIRRAIEFQELKSANRLTIRRNQERFTFKNIVARGRPCRRCSSSCNRWWTSTPPSSSTARPGWGRSCSRAPSTSRARGASGPSWR